MSSPYRGPVPTQISSTVTTPVVPSTSMSAPFGMRLVASVAETMHGIPISRLTIAACENGAPTSTTTAEAATNSGVQDGSVIGAMRISPGSSAEGSSGVVRTRAMPRAVPVQPDTPTTDSPAASAAPAAPARSDQPSSGGTSSDTTNGGLTSKSAM